MDLAHVPESSTPQPSLFVKYMYSGLDPGPYTALILSAARLNLEWTGPEKVRPSETT